MNPISVLCCCEISSRWHDFFFFIHTAIEEEGAVRKEGLDTWCQFVVSSHLICHFYVVVVLILGITASTHQGTSTDVCFSPAER